MRRFSFNRHRFRTDIVRHPIWLRIRDIKTLQKFAAVHAAVHNHFNLDRHLNRRDTFKQSHSAALGRIAQSRRC